MMFWVQSARSPLESELPWLSINPNAVSDSESHDAKAFDIFMTLEQSWRYRAIEAVRSILQRKRDSVRSHDDIADTSIVMGYDCSCSGEVEWKDIVIPWVEEFAVEKVVEEMHEVEHSVGPEKHSVDPEEHTVDPEDTLESPIYSNPPALEEPIEEKRPSKRPPWLSTRHSIVSFELAIDGISGCVLPSDLTEVHATYHFYDLNASRGPDMAVIHQSEEYYKLEGGEGTFVVCKLHEWPAPSQNALLQYCMTEKLSLLVISSETAKVVASGHVPLYPSAQQTVQRLDDPNSFVEEQKWAVPFRIACALQSEDGLSSTCYVHGQCLWKCQEVLPEKVMHSKPPLCGPIEPLQLVQIGKKGFESRSDDRDARHRQWRAIEQWKQKKGRSLEEKLKMCQMMREKQRIQ